MNELRSESQSELLSRLDLIQAMVEEGRRITEYWGWVFVLWGAAYLIAIGWSYWAQAPQWAWPVTMIAATVLTVIFAVRKTRNKPRRGVGRAMGSIWLVLGISIFAYIFSVANSGHYEPHASTAAIEILLGMANGASALIIRSRVQLLIAVLWWASGIATCFVALGFVLPILLIDAVFGMIAFGIYLMACERRDRRLRAQTEVHPGATHA